MLFKRIFAVLVLVASLLFIVPPIAEICGFMNQATAKATVLTGFCCLYVLAFISLIRSYNGKR